MSDICPFQALALPGPLFVFTPLTCSLLVSYLQATLQQAEFEHNGHSFIAWGSSTKRPQRLPRTDFGPMKEGYIEGHDV